MNCALSSVRVRALSTCAMVLFMSDVAVAQEAPQMAQADGGGSAEILVTAQRRSERNQDVPISIANIGSEQLTSANAQSLSDIVKLSAGVRFERFTVNDQEASQPVFRKATSLLWRPNCREYNQLPSLLSPGRAKS